MVEKVTRTVVDGDGRPVATITADDTEANREALARLDRLGMIEREAFFDLLAELESLQESD
jgi:antitoxin (DNA-binding transcriptional repressor) of toxin-antitoxin stability system